MTNPAEYVPDRYWEERYGRFDLASSGHRDLPEAYNRWLYRRKMGRIRECLRKEGFPASSSRVLELGCGTGVYVEMWKSMGVASLTGFDITAASVEHLAPRYPEYRFHREDVSDPGLLERHPGGFDLVTAFDVLYHVVEDGKFARALENISALSRPGALLLVHDMFLPGPDLHHGYIRWRSLEAYARELDRAGFDILRRLPIFCFMIQASRLSGHAALLHGWAWKGFRRAIERAPDAAGRALNALDGALLGMMREGPSMHLAVCRKRD